MMIDIERKTLERFRHCVQMAIDERSCEQRRSSALTLYTREDPMVIAGRQLIATLQYDVFADHKTEHTVRWPASWWQHIKHAWFPRWLLRRWPVRWAMAVFRCCRIYPDVEALGRVYQYVEMIDPPPLLPPKRGAA